MGQFRSSPDVSLWPRVPATQSLHPIFCVESESHSRVEWRVGWRDIRQFFPSLPPPGRPWWLSGKESACNEEDQHLIPGSERYPGEGRGNPLQYSSLGNPTDRGAWPPWGCKESDTTEWLTLALHFHFSSPQNRRSPTCQGE